MADRDPSMKTSAAFYLEKLRGMVKDDPSSRLFLTLAEELRKRDELEEAMAVLVAGIGRNPTFAAARLTLGRWYLRDGMFREARDEFARVLQLSPGDRFALRYIKEAEHKIGDVQGVGVIEKLNRFLAGINRAFAVDQTKQAPPGGG